MVIMFTSFLNIDLSNIILPFLTVAVTVSFALGSLFSNLCLAMVYVFFMMPYEVGHKIIVGNKTEKIVGYVRSVSLLYTVLSTSYNECLRIPNHTLFSQIIYNQHESGGCVYEIVAEFCISGKAATSQYVIDDFIEEVKKFALTYRKSEWISCHCYSTQ